MIHVTINGQPRDLPDGSTVTALLAQSNLQPNNVAVELNRRLVRAAAYDTLLKDGDTLEIVTFVGGG